MNKGISYCLRNKLYLSLTNSCNSNTFLQLRGPSFQMPSSSQFRLLEEGFEPTAMDLFLAVDRAFDGGMIGVSSMDSDEITFAGLGEPLLRLEVLTECASLITEKRHGARLRVKTNGLILSSDSSVVAESIKRSGISDMSICLASDNPVQYDRIMSPQCEASFSDVCGFVVACVEAGDARIDLTCLSHCINSLITASSTCRVGCDVHSRRDARCEYRQRPSLVLRPRGDPFHELSLPPLAPFEYITD